MVDENERYQTAGADRRMVDDGMSIDEEDKRKVDEELVRLGMGDPFDRWSVHHWPQCGDSGTCPHAPIPLRPSMATDGRPRRRTRLARSAVDPAFVLIPSLLHGNAPSPAGSKHLAIWGRHHRARIVIRKPSFAFASEKSSSRLDKHGAFPRCYLERCSGLGRMCGTLRWTTSGLASWSICQTPRSPQLARLLRKPTRRLCSLDLEGMLPVNIDISASVAFSRPSYLSLAAQQFSETCAQLTLNPRFGRASWLALL